jgi:Tol biopolymer transport system component
MSRLEYPVGKTLLDFDGSLTNPRISPRGDKIALLQRGGTDDDIGSVAIVDVTGRRKLLTNEKYEVLDLAWSPRGDEVWFTVSDRGTQRSIHAVSLDGRERTLLEIPGNIILKDVFSDGRVLLVREDPRRELSGLIEGETRERDFSWFDWTHPDDVSPGGSFLCSMRQA